MLVKIKKKYLQTVNLLKYGGRNNTGKITINARGGGHKRQFRFLDWKYVNSKGFFLYSEYDPNRTVYLATMCYRKQNKIKYYYITMTKNKTILNFLLVPQSKSQQWKNIGNLCSLSIFDIGDFLSNIMKSTQQGAKYVRSAGTFSQLIQKNYKLTKMSLLKLPSGEYRLFENKCKAIVGINANENHRYRVLKKAGRRRWLRYRPKVRGVAKNPVDHPHGGGEGKTSGGRPSVTPLGLPTRGVCTRKKKKKNRFILLYSFATKKLKKNGESN